MASLEDLLRQTQASYEFYLDNPEDEFNYDYTEPMMQPMMQPMEQTMMQPLTQDISIPNYIMPDMYEDDDEGASYNLPLDVARKGTALSNATKKTAINLARNAFLNTVLPGSGTVIGLASLANNYFNPTGLNAFDVPTYADNIDTDRYEGFSFTETPGMQYGSGVDDPSLDTGDSDGGTGSGADEGGSGADSGSGTHDDPGD